MEPRLPPKDPDPDPPGFPETPNPNPDEADPDVYPVVEPDEPAPQRIRASRFVVLAAALVVFLPACQTQQERDAEREGRSGA